ncbi:MAG TPA: 2-oxobutyrate oxidase, partial [Rhodospirillum rubrum]|nr:2-oxobutyrate oxidase [Rhodospirillum rubrum]
MGWDGARQGPPVLSLKAGEGEAARRDEFLATLRQAARDPGAFYLEGHGIDPSVIDQVEALSRRFFALPEDEKRAIDMVNSPHFHGYTRVGAELTRGAPDWREQLDIGSERPLLPQGPDTPAWARLQGPNQWPAALPDLRAAVLRLQAELTAVALALLERIALALGERADFFADLYEGGPDQLLKIIRYPGRAAGEGDQ